ncbi:MAG TPA: ParB/RepB/Spo0J family partition protein [Candidatus Paceibacterota bacterium]|nr:ParB/RepB/Spo0J family partition protein [Candidatus Paceibacterota bacterium]
MTGKGLESLIPKKGGRDEGILSKDAVASPGVSKTPLDSQNRFSDASAAIGDNNSSVSDALSQSPPRSLTREEAVFQIEVEKIKPNPYQPRREFNEEDIEDLARSIREFGIIQPLVVTKTERETDTGTAVEYELIAGERRLIAARKAGLRTVPAIVKRVSVGKAKLELALVENIQRSNLNPIETARAYARLQDEFNLTHQEIAARVGKSRTTVTNAIRLLTLPADLQDAVASGRMTPSDALSALARSAVGNASRAAGGEAPDPEKAFWEKRLEERFGAPVTIIRKDGKGKMTIHFHSREELKSILEKLLGDENLET